MSSVLKYKPRFFKSIERPPTIFFERERNPLTQEIFIAYKHTTVCLQLRIAPHS